MPRRGLAAVLSFAALLTLTGCAVGERPYFDEEPAVTSATGFTGDSAIDAVLAKLDAPSTGPLTAAYNGRVNFGSTEFTALVLLDGASRSVTVSNAIWRDTPSGRQTCTVNGVRPCEDGLNAAAASDTPLTIDFYNADAAVRLRNKAASRIGPGGLHSETFAGQSATCVDVPLSNGEETGVATYCVLDNGIVAQINDADVTLELVLYLDSVDGTQFALQ